LDRTLSIGVMLLPTIACIDTAIHICNNLSQSEHPTTHAFIRTTDVLDKLQNTLAILHYGCHHGTRTFEDPTDPLVVATYYVIDSVKQIRGALSAIKTMVQKHHKRLFRHFYTPNYTHVYKTLETHICVHDLRVRRLVHLLPIREELVDEGHAHATHTAAAAWSPVGIHTRTRRHSWS